MIDPISPNYISKIQLCRNSSIFVFFTRHQQKFSAGSCMFAEWWDGEIFIDGRPESQLILPIVKLTTGAAAPSSEPHQATLKLAKLLHHRGFHITYVNTEFNHSLPSSTSKEKLLLLIILCFQLRSAILEEGGIGIGRTSCLLGFKFGVLVGGPSVSLSNDPSPPVFGIATGKLGTGGSFES
ncbi:unnamed protein product [Linum tenue]|uniref:Uncharacterized protein n=1 Tax=Linum tenue TaxID=586396 RepID=A0AAV0IAS3_9ROSI|nr:unnamed protein product [Linum tenue]